MVSTRGAKYKFNENEKVLCYEPDLTKAKVLYDSKVLDIFETKDKKGKRVIEYLIHFQGWNSSWDRRVIEDFVLKDTEENRQLQRDLAEKSQLHLGAYLYRKERKKRSRKSSERYDGTSDSKLRNRGSSEDGSSCSVDDFGNTDLDTEYYSSSVESSHEEERVSLQVGEHLKEYLEFDYNQITKLKKFVNLPAKLSVIGILENYVRNYAIKQLFGPMQEPSKTKRRNSSAKIENKTKDYESIKTNIELCKEVADGIRIYFDFALKDYLLYQWEKQQGVMLASEEFLEIFVYNNSANLCLDLLSIKPEGSPVIQDTIPEYADTCTASSSNYDEKTRRRLRSYKNEENDVIFDLKSDNISSIGSTSSESSNPKSFVLSMDFLRSIIPMNIGITSQSKEILDDVFSWRMLPPDPPTTEPSMIYGAIHLTRLIIKLPEFLTASQISDQKLKVLLKYLDLLVGFLEDHSEFYGENHYRDFYELKEYSLTDESAEIELKLELEDEDNDLGIDFIPEPSTPIMDDIEEEDELHTTELDDKSTVLEVIKIEPTEEIEIKQEMDFND